MAAEFWSAWGANLAITLTPSDDGRLEVYLDREKIFDHKAEGGKYPDLERVRALKQVIKKKMAAVGVR
ncbi:MAG: hypothetical protein EXR47_05265 [Dehalococcoidia bacterium]|nr:hypothetical protein [Dehalococcoidia bacterium]